MIENIINFYSSSDIVKFFFWGPVVFNMIFYPIHVWKRVQIDRRALTEDKYHTDFVTMGDLFKYLFLVFIPVVNALALFFHALPIAWEYICKKFDWFFSIKLVKDTRK